MCRESPRIPLQLKYRKDLSKMKGTSHFHSLTSEDNLALKNARKINKIVSEVGELVGTKTRLKMKAEVSDKDKCSVCPASVCSRHQIQEILCQFQPTR